MKAKNDGVAVESSSIRRMIERAARLLPAQGPIEVFVHHNTLHAFESQTFHDAVKAGLERYQAQPYLPEREYHDLYLRGRIADNDLEEIVASDLAARNNQTVAGLATCNEIRLAMLRHPFQVGPDAELRWIVAETDALETFRPHVSGELRQRVLRSVKDWLPDQGSEHCVEPGGKRIVELEDMLDRFGHNWSKWSDSAWESFSMHLLWRICLHGATLVPPKPFAHSIRRPRDLLLLAGAADTDRDVHDMLIRYCAAFLDQGYASWSLPGREDGFYESFLALYSRPSRGREHWLRHLPKELSLLLQDEVSASESISRSMSELGVAADCREEFIAESLLSLGGWAGMVWQLESGVDWVVHSIPTGSLVGMLAVQLILEIHAIRRQGMEAFGESSLPMILDAARTQVASAGSSGVEQRAFLLFQASQTLGWTPAQLLSLDNDAWLALFAEVEGFSAIDRRRVYHEAYERKYRFAALDAFHIHAGRRQRLAQPREDRPAFQIATCIDDREESFRRHLEETAPRCETFGAAGFFAVAMNYRGAADGFYKPLCPAVITPEVFVREDVGYTFEGVHRDRAQLRRRLGLASHAFHTRSRTFLGGMFAGLLGSLAAAPLVARVLFPRLTARIRRRFGALLQPPPVTQLQLERYTEAPGPSDGHIGYSTDEMASVVVRLLEDIGLTRNERFARVFIVCGHGSSSLNNPHESAYCCGACAGKRGGPNARAFAMMANDWRVREKVAAQGIAIPTDMVFVGAYHNTCDDSVVFYDLDRLPASHRRDFESARESIEEARRRNASERCRRFESAPLGISPQDALRHVEARAQDISQARPEYNHATNAICVVGRREWSRGLFLDRRAFLTSYDSTQDDDEQTILYRILSAAIPVCAGINLEYYFSRVDSKKYGAGSKLPHNIVSLLGVMEGTSSDLRTGLYQQMVEIHEPLRLLFLIEATPEAMLSIMDRSEAIGRLCRGNWVHLAVIDPRSTQIQVYEDGAFRPHVVSDDQLAVADSSLACCEGERENLPFFSIREAGTPR